ncbi:MULTISPECIES: hypothetical protein, partial [unclassified Paenibacillus]|uniref:hypothetical protein n=1 Tax=unclassified Paenibacillus TaxID=185978 RepID=UPI003642175D
LVPRHPPCALISLTIPLIISIQMNRVTWIMCDPKINTRCSMLLTTAMVSRIEQLQLLVSVSSFQGTILQLLHPTCGANCQFVAPTSAAGITS